MNIHNNKYNDTLIQIFKKNYLNKIYRYEDICNKKNLIFKKQSYEKIY